VFMVLDSRKETLKVFNHNIMLFDWEHRNSLATHVDHTSMFFGNQIMH